MESRKKGLYTAKICRFCLSQDEPLTSLFEKKQAPKNSIPLSLKILSSISVEVFPSEKMPPYICNRCTFFMEVMYNFKNICREADKSILDFVQSGSALEPIAWQPSLVKLFRYGAKKPVDVLKVESGATVEVSQGISDTEDEDENVYNVKIEDGLEEQASACVKVVTSKETEKSPKNKKKVQDCDWSEWSAEACILKNEKFACWEPNDKFFTAIYSEDVAVEGRGNAPGRQDGGCWACDECDCTFPLQQLLELHKMQKHRARDVACHLCDAKFFSKGDLAVHQVRHSNNMPFQCVACGKTFKRHILLKRHERMIHSDLPQHKCQHCPASFLSEEEFEAHQVRHSNINERNFHCMFCSKRFLNNEALMKHVDNVHQYKPTHFCEYCPERFTTIAKLTRHVRTHAGERPYPCKYCDKSFTKSHHYTRHLRVKHADASRGTRSSLDEYRCEQCTAAFPSQDELIYHSAIHATQNLTCPLCQEKFEDVDAVTAHIKSHVTGMEFMCDFCELVFTTKNKLDMHIVNIHEDELHNTDEQSQDETSMDMDGEEEEDDDDNPINVKDEGDHMVVEIKKPNEFLLSASDREFEEKMNNTNSEESEPECMREGPPAQLPPLTPAPQAPAPPAGNKPELHKLNNNVNAPTATILRKAEEIKRKTIQETPTPEKKEKPKVESSTGGASDKSLRLLEKELQELQRTNKREENTKTPVKASEPVRNRGRPQIHTSTPKLRSEEKKSQTRSTPVEKKVPERRAVKENKKPEDSKEPKTNIVSAKEVKEKDEKDTKTKEDKETKANVSKEEIRDKSVVKNVSNNKSASDEPVRRSSRPSKVKDYAKMINNSPRTEESTPSDDDTEDDDEEYIEEEKPEVKPKSRRAGQQKPAAKQAAKTPPAPPAAAPAKKRGRPRKDIAPQEVPAKVKKPDAEVREESKQEKMETEETQKPASPQTQKPASPQTQKPASPQTSPEQDDDEKINTSQNTPKSANEEQKASNLLVPPTGATLKKVPIKALPPGVKPLPLPTRPVVGSTDVCEMQIGKKMVKVQKIVMTKAEVEAMAKKGLVEMKDGTMVLKAGVKIPSDPSTLKSTLVGEGEKKTIKESPGKVASAPMRCELDEA